MAEEKQDDAEKESAFDRIRREAREKEQRETERRGEFEQTLERTKAQHGFSKKLGRRTSDT